MRWMITLSIYTIEHPLELLDLRVLLVFRELRVILDQQERREQQELVLKEQQDQQGLRVILDLPGHRDYQG
jgi:hypothetical protein